ncbi:MAG: divergent polysaccharide deacetylase family protein [Pseudomonadota bacterium]
MARPAAPPLNAPTTALWLTLALLLGLLPTSAWADANNSAAAPAAASAPAATATMLTLRPQAEAFSAQPVLAIVIDDLGYSPARDAQALALPGPLTVAVLPDAPHATAIARQASALGREVILHQPMEPLIAPRKAEPGILREHMTSADYAATLSANLAAVPGSVGINNHRGSRLTAHSGAMDELMLQLLSRQLYFLDSRTTAATVAHDAAREWGVPTVKRDVFLDHFRDPASMDVQFRRALRIARRQGHAVLIAHPHRSSLEYLEQALRTLPGDIRTARVSDLINDIDRQR